MATSTETRQIAKETGQTVNQTRRPIKDWGQIAKGTAPTVGPSASDAYSTRAERVRRRQSQQREGPADAGSTLGERIAKALEDAASALREDGGAFQVTDSGEVTEPQDSAEQSPAQHPGGQSPTPSDTVGTVGTVLTAEDVAQLRQELTDLKQQQTDLKQQQTNIATQLRDVVIPLLRQFAKEGISVRAWDHAEPPAVGFDTNPIAGSGAVGGQAQEGQQMQGEHPVTMTLAQEPGPRSVQKRTGSRGRKKSTRATTSPT